MSRASPPVTVCLPVYNGARYLEESIASVLAQTYPDFRLIVSDNWSTDASAAIVRSFRDPRLTYVQPAKHLAVVPSNNYCLGLATGEYVCAWAHDDVMMPDNLRRKVDALNEHPQAGFVHSNVLVIDGDGRTLGEHWASDSRRDYVEPGPVLCERYLHHMARGSLIFIGAVLARRACYQQLGNFRSDIPFSFDSEMWMRMALSYDVACLGDPLVKYRKHPSMTSAAIAATQDLHGLNYRGFVDHLKAVRIILDEHRDRIPHRGFLKRAVVDTFTREALRQALALYHARQFRGSRAFLVLALRMAPSLSTRSEWWGIALRLATRFRHTIRRRLTR